MEPGTTDATVRVFSSIFSKSRTILSIFQYHKASALIKKTIMNMAKNMTQAVPIPNREEASDTEGFTECCTELWIAIIKIISNSIVIIKPAKNFISPLFPNVSGIVIIFFYHSRNICANTVSAIFPFIRLLAKSSF